MEGGSLLRKGFQDGAGLLTPTEVTTEELKEQIDSSFRVAVNNQLWILVSFSSEILAESVLTDLRDKGNATYHHSIEL